MILSLEPKIGATPHLEVHRSEWLRPMDRSTKHLELMRSALPLIFPQQGAEESRKIALNQNQSQLMEPWRIRLLELIRVVMSRSQRLEEETRNLLLYMS